MHKVEGRRISDINGRIGLARCVRWCECSCYLCLYCPADTFMSCLLAFRANSRLAGHPALEALSMFLARSLQLCFVLQNELTDFPSSTSHLGPGSCEGETKADG